MVFMKIYEILDWILLAKYLAASGYYFPTRRERVDSEV